MKVLLKRLEMAGNNLKCLKWLEMTETGLKKLEIAGKC